MVGFSNASNALDAVFREAVREVREACGGANVSDFSFTVRAFGRSETDEDTVQIEYRLSGRYGDNDVKGNCLDVVLLEFLRRNGWNNANAPLMLGYRAG